MAPSATYTTTGTSANDITWGSWVDCATSTSAAATSEVWTYWAQDSASTSANITHRRHEPVQETEEQRQVRAEQAQRRKEECEAARQKKEVAQRKAEELLRENLDEEQRKQFDETQWFYVISQSGKRYRIRHNWVGNIDEINEDDLIAATHCIHPAIRVPIEDSMLIQKLMLEADEQRLIEIANRIAVRVPYPVLV